MREEQPSVTAAVVAATLLLLRDDPELGHLVDRRTLPAVEQPAARKRPPPSSGELVVVAAHAGMVRGASVDLSSTSRAP